MEISMLEDLQPYFWNWEMETLKTTVTEKSVFHNDVEP